MPTTATPTVRDLQDQVVAAVRQGEESALDAIRAVVDAVAIVAARLPAVATPLAERLPTPEALVSGAYDLAGHLLAEQRKFTEEVLKAAAPLRRATEELARAGEPADAKHAGGKPDGARK